MAGKLRLVGDGDNAPHGAPTPIAGPAHRLHALLMQLAPTGVWTGSRGALAQELEVAPRTVTRWIEALERDGVMRVQHSDGQESTYIVERDVQGDVQGSHVTNAPLDGEIEPETLDTTLDIGMSRVPDEDRPLPRAARARDTDPSSSSSSTTLDIPPHDRSPGGDPMGADLTIGGKIRQAGFLADSDVADALAELSPDRLDATLRIAARKAQQIWQSEERRLPTRYLLTVARQEKTHDAAPLPPLDLAVPASGDAPRSAPEAQVVKASAPATEAPRGRGTADPIVLKPGERIGATDPRWPRWRTQLVDAMLRRGGEGGEER